MHKPILTRTGDPDATAALFSLPLPKGQGNRLVPAHARAGVAPLAWWKRDVEPRRVLAAVAVPAGDGLPETLTLKNGRAPRSDAVSPWTLATPPTTERLPFVAPTYTDIDSLRGMPATDCTTIEYALDLTYGGRTLRLQPGATGPGAAECLWQNVQIDRLWRHAAAEAVRVGGIIYNEDTYLWADLYLILFANGVASATLHFTNTKLQVKGYDFNGLPYLKIMGAGIRGVEAELPRDGWRQGLGAAAFNFADTAATCGPESPATLRTRGAAVYYTPFARILHPQKPDAPPERWEPGYARTVRFQFSLSEAAPAVARYVVPAWWYAVSGEPWAGDRLPVLGRLAPTAAGAVESVRAQLKRGAFDGGSSGAGNNGDCGVGLMRQAYLTGDAATYRDALDLCAFWADLMVDHTDFTVRQWIGGWGWKTCAYTKFRDILFGWLETGDPWMRDTLERVAESYYAWFRANWPRNTIGRDAMEVGSWALLWRYDRSELARERVRELVRMMRTVLTSRGVIGGQMGAGPHPGWHASLYMTGVSMVSLMEVLEAEGECGRESEELLADLETLHRHYMRDDVEMWPVSFGKAAQSGWKSGNAGALSSLVAAVYALLGRHLGFGHPIVREGFDKLRPWAAVPVSAGRLGDQLAHPWMFDALMLEARLTPDGAGIRLAPAFGVGTLPWPARQVVATPWGPLEITAVEGAAGVALTLDAPRDFEVRLTTEGGTVVGRSRGVLRPAVGGAR